MTVFRFLHSNEYVSCILYTTFCRNKALALSKLYCKFLISHFMILSQILCIHKQIKFSVFILMKSWCRETSVKKRLIFTLTLTGMWSWFCCQRVGSLGMLVWLGVSDWNATWGNQILSITSICSRFRRYFSLQNKEKTWATTSPLYSYKTRNLISDILTPFQASVVFQEFSAICPWPHSAGNWINLP